MKFMTIIIIIIFNMQIIAIFIRSVKRECISISQSIMHQTDNIEYFYFLENKNITKKVPSVLYKRDFSDSYYFFLNIK